jgi:hypothetical protein
MNCPTCGQAVLTGTSFCSNCGAELAVEEDHSALSDTHTVLDTEPAPYLLITAGLGRGQTFELRGEVHLGRSRTNAIALSDSKVSRNHARLDPVRSTYILTDLGSANGTFVNGVRIAQPVRLQGGDLLQVGDTHLIFHTHPAADFPQGDHAAADLRPPVRPADPRPAPGSLPLPRGNSRRLPAWAWVGCAVLLITFLLIAVALTIGVFIGQGLGGL